MSGIPRRWCLWCGEPLPRSMTLAGDFCVTPSGNSPCAVSYYEDVGGFDLYLGRGESPPSAHPRPNGISKMDGPWVGGPQLLGLNATRTY